MRSVVSVGLKKPKGGANIFLRLLFLDPNKGKRCADFPLCSEASRSFQGVVLQGADTQRKIHRKGGSHVREKRLIGGHLNDKRKKIY